MKPMLTQVLDDLSATKGDWAAIAREIEPDNTVSFYSWLTKLAQGVIRDPSVNKIQRLYDYFRARELVAGQKVSTPRPEPSGSWANSEDKSSEARAAPGRQALGATLLVECVDPPREAV